MKWGRLFFYLLALADLAMFHYVRWVEDSRPEAGYWLACACMNFLIGYILFEGNKSKPSCEHYSTEKK